MTILLPLPIEPKPVTTERSQKALSALQQAELIYSVDTVMAATRDMAAAITERLGTTDPVVLAVMHGGLMPTAWIVSQLHFPLQLGYLHATRYRGETRGGELNWQAKPSLPVVDRVVLVIDDIYDEGLTLKAIVDELYQWQARQVYTAVLINKQHNRKLADLPIDFVGLEVEDRYVFGCGMDYHDYLRNLPNIYAVHSP